MFSLEIIFELSSIPLLTWSFGNHIQCIPDGPQHQPPIRHVSSEDSVHLSDPEIKQQYSFVQSFYIKDYIKMLL